MPDMNENAETQQEYFGRAKIETDYKDLSIRLYKRIAELTDELKTLRESIKDYGAGCYENGLRNGKIKLEEDDPCPCCPYFLDGYCHNCTHEDCEKEMLEKEIKEK